MRIAYVMEMRMRIAYVMEMRILSKNCIIVFQNSVIDFTYNQARWNCQSVRNVVWELHSTNFYITMFLSTIIKILKIPFFSLAEVKSHSRQEEG